MRKLFRYPNLKRALVLYLEQHLFRDKKFSLLHSNSNNNILSLNYLRLSTYYEM